MPPRPARSCGSRRRAACATRWSSKSRSSIRRRRSRKAEALKIQVARPRSTLGMALSLETHLTLADGTKMPVLGLGVWRAASGKETQRAVGTALQVGYRLIDTAKLYGNERDVGQAVRAFEQSRRELGLDTIDLYLIHRPVPGLRRDSWKALLRLTETGLARSI